MDEKLFRSLQVLALKSVEEPDYAAFYRRVCRWYSKSFSQNLDDVMMLADEVVLQAYFEETYYELATGSDEEQKRYEEIRGKLLIDESSPEDEAEDDDWARQLNEEVRAQQDRQKTGFEEPQEYDKDQEDPGLVKSKDRQKDRQTRVSDPAENPNFINDSGFVSGESEFPEE